MGFAGHLRHGWGALLAALVCLVAPAHADELEIAVRDAGGKPVEDAVVDATRLDADGSPEPAPASAIIDQIDKEYVPYVTAVRVGTSISFPNHDQIRHHVYSFSPVKTFEIPLYEGVPAAPVVFDKPGTVPLGCNIHDWMKAYVFVSESPWFAVTDTGGKAAIELPPGEYAVEVWHPELQGEPAATRQRVSVTGGGASLDFSIERKRVLAPRRAPARGRDGGYR